MYFAMYRQLTPFLIDMRYTRVERSVAQDDIKSALKKSSYIVSASPSLGGFMEGEARAGGETLAGSLYIQMAAGPLEMPDGSTVFIKEGDLFTYEGELYEVKDIANEPSICDVADYRCERLEVQINP